MESIRATTLEGVRRAIDELAQQIGAPPDALPTIGQSSDFGRPHIEVDKRGYHYVVAERGVERERKTVADLQELLFLAFRDVTRAMAWDYEARHRKEDQDPRRMAFAKQLELLEQVNPEWRNRVEAEQGATLAVHSLDDFALLRARYCKELRDQGQDPEAAWRAACDAYPLPK